MISHDVLHEPRWPFQSLDGQNRQYTDQFKKVQTVVHPHYSLLEIDDTDNIAIWKRARGDVDAYVEMNMVEAAEKAVSTLRIDSKAVPAAYLHCMELVQEFDSLRKEVPQDTLRIFVLPRQVDLHPIQREMIMSLIGKYSGMRNTLVAETRTSDSGALSEDTIETFRNLLPSNASVRFEGGYLLMCLDRCVNSVTKTGREDLKLSIDFDASSYAHAVSGRNVREKGFDDLMAFGNDCPPLVLPREKLTTMQAVTRWVHDNEQFNAYYKEFVMKKYDEARRERRKDSPKEYCDPDRVNVSMLGAQKESVSA
jgi:hypothetical protein